MARAFAGFGFRPSNFGDRDGVALVITLIMLSIITFMAVTFLVLSQRERSSVNTATDQKTARNASDAGFARVSAELLTHIMLNTNFQDFNLLASTNYINLRGLQQGYPQNLDPTNVNYDYLLGGGPIVNSQDRNINIASLLFNPRPPVFVVTNTGTGAGEFRYYLDLNRNGRFDKNGTWPVVVTDNSGVPWYVNRTNGALVSTNLSISTILTNTYLLSDSFVGDPEWIGVLERPEELHSADNRFIARYAYIVIPAGKTLDVNYIHNRAKRISNLGEGFLRNQGVGTWEINLAAFLADLNTNAWWNPAPGYVYRQNNALDSWGSAFTNANEFLNYRYGNTPGGYLALSNASAVLANPPGTLAAALTAYNIDAYSDGPLMLGTATNESTTPDNPTISWSGAENPNHYFSTQDIFSQMPPGFRSELSILGTSNDSYNAYTFYRMLAQLGTDSTANQGKININFRNMDNQGNVIPGMETNLMAWTPLGFFTNAAAAMFRQMNLRDFNGNLVTVTNIPIYEDPVTGHTNLNYYTPAVHRVLQLAANIFDATTNRFVVSGPTNYPSVFRPVFRSQNGVAYIAGYQEVTNSNDAFLQYLEPQNFVKTNQPLNTIVNLYGVPWVIGAKKGFPNFNEFSMENALTVTRKLEFTNATVGTTWFTNQIFDFALTNDFAVEAWNSYTNGYGRPLRLVVTNEVSVVITNETGFSLLAVSNLAFGNDTTVASWPGWSQKLTDNSFVVPLQIESQFTNGIYGKANNGSVFFLPPNPAIWGVTFVPRLWMTLQSKIRYFLIDTTANRVVDFVNIVNTQPAVDIGATLQNGYSSGTFPDKVNVDAMWDMRLMNNIEKGILNQIAVSYNANTSPVWTDPAKVTRSDAFRKNLEGNGGTNRFQAPYSPPRTIYQRVSLEANDPLVHYTSADMTSTNDSKLVDYNVVSLGSQNPRLPTLKSLNFAYQPWGGMHTPGNGDLNVNNFRFDWRVKDPMVEQSDNWDFPTNKLPNIGWLGRVHRGTPWQTVYLKSSNLNPADWTKWSNDNVTLTNGINVLIDAPLTHPTDDYRLFDLFTAAINESASSGQLDVNQTNLAAWSAVFSGVNVLSNSPSGWQSLVVSPAGVYNPTKPSPVAAMVQGINAARGNTNGFAGTVFQNHVFQHAGDVLAAPQLTALSPFLNTNNFPNTLQNGNLAANGINDEVMERIPQQIMSLLTLNKSPRFVIYSFGQTLHPADHSLVTGGTFNGLCTNYQITAESAVRAVVRMEGTPDPQFVGGKVDSEGRSYPPHLVVEQFNLLGPD